MVGGSARKINDINPGIVGKKKEKRKKKGGGQRERERTNRDDATCRYDSANMK